MYVCVLCVSGAHGSLERALNHWNWSCDGCELHHVDAGNQTQARPFTRSTSALHLWAVSPAPVMYSLVKLRLAMTL